MRNECIAADAGTLCVAKAAAADAAEGTAASGGSTSSSTVGTSCSGQSSTAAAGSAPLGGAILEMLSSEISKPSCAAEVAELSGWLQGKSTYMGFNFTNIAAPQSNNEQASGVQWQVIGSLEGSNLQSWPICGNAHGGPGPQRGLTLMGTALGK
jgi:hypothetical protein